MLLDSIIQIVQKGINSLTSLFIKKADANYLDCDPIESKWYILISKAELNSSN